MTQIQITYKKTIVGFYNFTIVDTEETFNVEPAVFLATTGVHERTRTGCIGLDDAQLATLLTAPFTRKIRRITKEVAA